MKKLVVNTATLKFQGATVGTISFISSPSTKCTCENNGVYKGSVQVQVASGAVQGSYQTVAPYTATFTPLSTKCKCENSAPLREDDSVVVAMPAQLMIPPFTAGTINDTIIINTCGQSTVQSE